MGHFSQGLSELRLPAAARLEPQALPSQGPPLRPPAVASAQELGPRQVLGLLLRYWKLVAACVVAALVAAVVMLAVVAPVYEADALLQVEPGDPATLRAARDPTATSVTQDAHVAGAIELLRSRQVLDSAMDALRLDLEIRPEGAAALHSLSRRLGLSTVSDAARIEIEALELPAVLIGEPLRLVLQDGERYRLEHRGQVVVNGAVGDDVREETPSGTVAIHVRTFAGAAGTRFALTQSSRAETQQRILKRLRVSEQGKDSGLIRLGYRATDPATAADVLNFITREYQAQDVGWRSERAARALAFLEGQLPALQLRVEKAEAALARLKLSSGAPDLSAETTLLMQQSVAAEDVLNKLQQQRQDLEQRFTAGHPSMAALRAQIGQASAQRAQIEQRIARLPGSQRELATLTRELEVNMRLYVAMLDEVQRLQVAKSGTVGAVRIVDRAVEPVQAVFPRPGTLLVAALIVGVVLGCGLAVLAAAMRRRVDCVSDIERASGVRCLAALPASPLIPPRMRRSTRGPDTRNTSTPSPSIYRLRGALVTDAHALRGGAVLIGGLEPDSGHDNIAGPLGRALSQAALRTVIVDLDFERASGAETGSALCGASDWLTRRAFEIDGLVEAGDEGAPDRVGAGSCPALCVDRIPPQRLRSLIEGLRVRYDYVLVRTPALSVFADALIVATAVDGVMLVGRHLRQGSDDLDRLRRQLEDAGARLIGIVLSQVRRSDRWGYLGAAAFR